MVFYRLEIRSKAMNIAEINRKKMLEKVLRHPKSSAEEQSKLGTFVVPSTDGDSEVGRGEAILIDFELKSIKV